MKILLINPPFHRLKEIRNIYLPLGIASLAAYCEKPGREIKLYNAENPTDSEQNNPLVSGIELLQSSGSYYKNLEDDDFIVWHEIRQVIEEFKPDVVGVSVMTCKFSPAIKLSAIVKEVSPKSTLVWGGPHCSAEGFHTLEKEALIDYAIGQEGEIAFDSLLNYLENGEAKRSELPSLIYRENGVVTQNKNSELIQDLDKLPFPKRDSDLFQERYPDGSMSNIMASRGCPYRCTFCDSNQVWGRSVRPRSIQNILDEMKELKEQYGVKVINFSDDTFTLDRKFTIEFCTTLRESDLDLGWTCTTRLNALSEEVCTAMKSSGITSMSCGIESGSDAILKKMKKGLTVRIIKNGINLLNKHHIDWHAFMMVGLPYETIEDIQATRRLVQELNPTTVYLSIFTPYPGSVLFEDTKKLGMLPDDYDWGKFSHQSLSNHFVADISKEDFKEIVIEMFKEVDAINLSFSSMVRKAYRRKEYYFKNLGHFLSIVSSKFTEKLRMTGS